MTDQEINIAIAKSLGVMRWTYMDGKKYPDTENYVRDLNAIETTWKALSQNEMDEYWQELVLQLRLPCFANAKQHAIAYLKAKNIYTKTKTSHNLKRHR